MLEYAHGRRGSGASITVVGDTANCTCSGRPGAEKFDKTRCANIAAGPAAGAP
jgi:hypothetical protein